ncbi:carbon-nitrogen hydrolase family protein [Thalassorhabdomicrobium marinisediminis]|uniref:carbon-nitrogen hydrolase family protein n=1 Tax=Thalassorhabdomicrobium marinisediminis TaxID=2170577 RepID=UPI00248FB4CF|nr:carbon-nitrogen hydrolase family protein [Thalassorhabdomicrobium marinisediminis]
MTHSQFRLAALQIGASPDGSQATLDTILSYEAEITAARPDVLVLPEAVLGGYPKGSDFGTQLGFRRPEGREEFQRYYDAAIDLDGAEVAALCELANRTGASIVAGIIERAASTLYCTAVFIDPDAGLTDIHRKLMPTGTERLIWGQGDGSTLPAVETRAGTAVAAICWENYMPLLRTALYAKGAEIWCAPTVDAREAWQSTMQHIALEGRCFVISACQFQLAPEVSGQTVAHWPEGDDLISGGSVILGPLGEVLAGPLRGSEGLLVAECDRSAIPRARYDFDVVGHYARPDVFQLSVDESEKRSVTFSRAQDRDDVSD